MDRDQRGFNHESARMGEGFSGGEWCRCFVLEAIIKTKALSEVAFQGIELKVVKHHEARPGFVVLPRRWMVERSFGWAARFRRLARDYERLASSPAACHWIAAVCLMLNPLFSKSA